MLEAKDAPETKRQVSKSVLTQSRLTCATMPQYSDATAASQAHHSNPRLHSRERFAGWMSHAKRPPEGSGRAYFSRRFERRDPRETEPPSHIPDRPRYAGPYRQCYWR